MRCRFSDIFLLPGNAMRHMPLECDNNIAVNGCSGFATSTRKGPFTAMLISCSRCTCLIGQITISSLKIWLNVCFLCTFAIFTNDVKCYVIKVGLLLSWNVRSPKSKSFLEASRPKHVDDSRLKSECRSRIRDLKEGSEIVRQTTASSPHQTPAPVNTVHWFLFSSLTS